MYGSDISSLSLQISTDDGNTWSSNIWNRNGNQGDSWNSSGNLNLNTYINNYVKLRFIGVIATANGQVAGDMAIDNIGLTAVTASVIPVANCQNITVNLDASGNATIVPQN